MDTQIRTIKLDMKAAPLMDLAAKEIPIVGKIRVEMIGWTCDIERLPDGRVSFTRVK